MVEIYSFVGTTTCKDDFLGLFWDWRRHWRECQTADCGGVSIEEEGICELDFILGRDGCCDAMEDSVIGPRDNLNCDGFFGGGGCR